MCCHRNHADMCSAHESGCTAAMLHMMISLCALSSQGYYAWPCKAVEAKNVNVVACTRASFDHSTKAVSAKRSGFAGCTVQFLYDETPGHHDNGLATRECKLHGLQPHTQLLLRGRL